MSILASHHVLLLDHKEGDGGGGGRYLVNLVQSLVQTRCRVDVAFLLACDDRCLRMELQELGANVHEISHDEIRPREVAAWLNDFLNSSDIDVLHVNWGGPVMRDCLAAWDVDQPWRGKRIYTLHGPLESRASLASWTWRDRLPFSWRRKKRRRLASFFKAFDHVISVSKRNAEDALRLYRLDPARLSVVPNGVDVDKFTPRQSDGADATAVPIRIGTCGRLSVQKRLDVLLRAFAGLPARRDLELHIAGSGPEEGSLRRLADELAVGDRTFFCGHVSDVAGFLQGLDIYVMTSEREGLPYALLEAMACGLPSVVTDVNELPDIIRHGSDGFVIPVDDVAACQQRMLELAQQPGLRAGMGDNARKRACDHFSQGQWQARTLSVYEKFLDLADGSRKFTEAAVVPSELG